MILIFILAVFTLTVLIYIQQPKFGKVPSGERLERIKESPNYKNGSFQNLSHTPDLTEGANFFTVLWKFIYNRTPRLIPTDSVPHEKTNLLSLPKHEEILVWFGHSSYFMQIDGKRILVDPVFSGSASPLSFAIRSFPGSDVYKTEDIPEIDYLFITHDHWDHLDYQTVKKLEPRVKKVICALGVAAHLEYWGYPPEKIIEFDWYESADLDNGFSVHALPARHFSGRGFRRNLTLWASYALQTPSMRIFIGGDSGYDTHFAQIGEKFGGFDLAILENGQYNTQWKYIHALPKEVLQAAMDLQAKRILPVHSSKFALALHSWDDPWIRISEANETFNLKLLTPLIGQPVLLKDSIQVYSRWWEGLN